jgi:Flp pilus assembly protein TadG
VEEATQMHKHVSRPSAGQAVAEFALIAPLVLLLLLAVGDFGRLYTSLVAVEASAREAADLGAFDPGNWNAALGPLNPSQTVVRMKQAACSSAAQSHLEGYAEPAGTVNHATCTNPSMTCTLEQPGQPPVDCASYTGGSGGCGDITTDPPCVVHVALTYEFDTLIRLPFPPPTLTFTRDARFAVSGLSTGAP